MDWKPFNPLNWIRKPQQLLARADAKFSYPLMTFLTHPWDQQKALIDTLIPAGGATLIFGPPKSLKSWFGMSLCLQAANKSPLVFGRFNADHPLRSIYVAAEDLPWQVVKRLQRLLGSQVGMEIDPDLVQIVPRCALDLSDRIWRQNLEAAIGLHRADFVVLDVLRRMFRGDVNSSKDTAAFLELLDEIRENQKCAIVLLHHSRKVAAEVQAGALGSINITAWADVLVQIKNKQTEGGRAFSEVEIESKIAGSPDPLRLVLDLDEPLPVFLESLGDGRINEAQLNLSDQWNSKDLAQVLEVGQRHAQRIIREWDKAGKVHRVGRGRAGLSRWSFCQTGRDFKPDPGGKTSEN